MSNGHEPVERYGLDVQDLIDSGMAWRLEGFVGRQCMAAIDSGDAILGPTGHTDYWGNYVPSRFEVVPGTKGSVEYAARIQQERGDDWRAWRDANIPGGE